METKVIWTMIAEVLVCLRVHGVSNRYVVSGVEDAAWKPGQHAVWKLWPAPAHRTSDLPTWDAEALPA